jgi:cystathionine gamma-synthase
MPRLRTLANKYGFLIVVDDTIGNFVNVEVLPYADILVSSLSKIFSGDANVMGGRLVENNPDDRIHAHLLS